MCRLRGVLVLALTALPVAGPSRAMAGDEVRVYGRQMAGGWVAAVEKEHFGAPGARAPRYRQRVVRQGPGDPQPVVLYEQTSTGSVRTHLRDDGLLMIQPVGPLPRLHFPGSKDPVELKLPPPQQWQYPFSPDTKIGTTWFLDDCLLYSRMAYPGHLLIGYVRIDTAKRGVTGGKLCLEVVEKEQAVASAAAPMPVVARLGEYVVWVNAGYHNSRYPDTVKGKWKSRKVRVFDLTEGRLLDPDQIPPEHLRENKDRLLKFVEEQAHNRSPELEVWAVGVIARFGGPKDAERLRALSRTVHLTPGVVAPGEGQVTDEVVKAAYADALETLEKKGPL